MGNTYKIIKITQKNELIIRIICNRTNIKVEKIGDTMPEDLPTPEKSIQQVEKEQLARLKAKAKAGKLMLDE